MLKKIISLLFIMSILVYSLTACNQEEEKPEFVAVLVSDVVAGYTPISQETFTENWDLDIPVQISSYDDSAEQILALKENFENGATGAIVCLSNTKDTAQFISLADEYEAPLIFYGVNPDFEYMENYDKCWYIGDLPEKAGEIMGNIIIDGKNDNLFFDVNEDLLLQYVVIEGERGNVYSDSVVTYAPRVIENYGLFTDRIKAENFLPEVEELEETLEEEQQEEVDEEVDSEEIIDIPLEPLMETDESFWTAQGTQDVILNLTNNSEKQIEAILCASPDIAVATVDVVKELNLDHEINIVTFGITEETRKLINSGDILGAAVYDEDMATDIMINFMRNALDKKSVTKDTEYNLDENRCTYINYEKLVCPELLT